MKGVIEESGIAYMYSVFQTQVECTVFSGTNDYLSSQDHVLCWDTKQTFMKVKHYKLNIRYTLKP